MTDISRDSYAEKRGSVWLSDTASTFCRCSSIYGSRQDSSPVPYYVRPDQIALVPSPKRP